MSVDLRGRSFLKLLDFTPEEATYLIDLSDELKAAKHAGTEVKRLVGKNIALIYEKGSTRTRCAFEVAAWDQGAHAVYLGPTGTQIGQKETMKDTARVLGRMFDAIEYRGFAQETVEDLAKYSGVPVWNGLTDDFHPTPILADVMTMREHSARPLGETAFCYLGDARFNMGNSLMVGGALYGMDFRIVAPKALWPDEALVTRCRALAEETGGRLTLTEEIEAGVHGADFVHTDVWVSMGQEGEREARLRSFEGFGVDEVLMGAAASHAVFLHCLPAKRGYEVTDAVIDGPQSIVFQEAENRLHTAKAIMACTMRERPF